MLEKSHASGTNGRWSTLQGALKFISDKALTIALQRDSIVMRVVLSIRQGVSVAE